MTPEEVTRVATIVRQQWDGNRPEALPSVSVAESAPDGGIGIRAYVALGEEDPRPRPVQESFDVTDAAGVGSNLFVEVKEVDGARRFVYHFDLAPHRFDRQLSPSAIYTAIFAVTPGSSHPAMRDAIRLTDDCWLVRVAGAA